MGGATTGEPNLSRLPQPAKAGFAHLYPRGFSPG